MATCPVSCCSSASFLAVVSTAYQEVVLLPRGARDNHMGSGDRSASTLIPAGSDEPQTRGTTRGRTLTRGAAAEAVSARGVQSHDRARVFIQCQLGQMKSLAGNILSPGVFTRRGIRGRTGLSSLPRDKRYIGPASTAKKKMYCVETCCFANCCSSYASAVQPSRGPGEPRAGPGVARGGPRWRPP